MTVVPLTLKRLPTATYVDTAVLSKGDVEGHGFHGNQWKRLTVMSTEM